MKFWIASILVAGLSAGCANSSSKPQPATAAAKATPEAKVVSKTAVKADAAAMIAVDDWAAAWQARDVTKYLGAYAADFKPEKGTRATWEKQRKERIGKAKDIKVAISELQVKTSAPDRATATFMQSYKSDSYSDKGKKALDLKAVNGKWLITREYAP